MSSAAKRAGYCGLDFGTSNSTVGTGGSTVIAEVRRLILQRVPNARPVKGDMFDSVGLGLAIDAERRLGALRT